MLRSLECGLFAVFLGAMFIATAHVLGVLNFEVCWSSPDGIWAHASIVSCALEGAIRKQVGFAAAVNWSFGLIILFPLFIYCACETANHGFLAVEQFVSNGMIVDRNWKKVPLTTVMRLLRRRRIALIVAGVLIAVISTTLLPLDYRAVVGDFYEKPELVVSFRPTDPELEGDWSIAAPICKHFDQTINACAKPSANYILNAVSLLPLTATWRTSAQLSACSSWSRSRCSPPSSSRPTSVGRAIASYPISAPAIRAKASKR
jgi:hypothetical protein